ncbi:MAG: hypothetical protein ACFB16_11525 [Phormidesmis sp.]
MVVVKGKRLAGTRRKLAAHLVGSISLLGILLVDTSVRAQEATSVNYDTELYGATHTARPSTARIRIPLRRETTKPDPTDKSMLRFEQVHFEQQRLERLEEQQQQLEQIAIAQRQDRFAQLSALLRSSPAPTVEAPPIVASPIVETAAPVSETYLYGQQPVANQPETTYFVFESKGADIVGALYMPSSSFDCVRGQMNNQRIALNVTDSYSQETYAYALRLDSSQVAVASQRGTVTAPPSIDGFYPLPVQASDRALLATCQAI